MFASFGGVELRCLDIREAAKVDSFLRLRGKDRRVRQRALLVLLRRWPLLWNGLWWDSA